MKSHNGMSITGAFSDGGISRKFIQLLDEISYRGITRITRREKLEQDIEIGIRQILLLRGSNLRPARMPIW
jgi:hypothetical protein